MSAPTCDLLWLSGIATEIQVDLRGRRVRLFRHTVRPLCWLDGGGERSWVVDISPGAAHIRRMRPDDGTLWRPWGGRRTDGAEVVAASLLEGDRVIVLLLRWRTRVGDDIRTRLVCEFGGRYTNAALVAEEGTVLDVLRAVDAKVNRLREVRPGVPYTPPPPLGRMRVDRPWAWEEDTDEPIVSFMMRRFLAMSAAWAMELCHRCGVPPEMAVRDLAATEREAMEAHARRMMEHPTPHLVLDEVGNPVDHLGFAPTHLPAERIRAVSHFAEASEMVWGHRVKLEQERRREEIRAAQLRRRRRKLERLCAHLREELARAEQADALHRTADLLMAHLSQIPPNAAEVQLTDWFDPNGRTITVQLDPTISPARQAERLYQRARKLRESIPHLRMRLARAERELGELAGGRGYSAQQEEGHVPSHPERKRASHGQVHPRRYRTKEGNWLVLVGRNERENDFLALKLAAPDDLWFHAHGCPGAHVILKREGRPDMPSRRALAEAASVAAYWSKARGASKVGVSYTFAKYVTKPKGAPPGVVTIRHEKLLVVPPALPPLAEESGG